MPKIELCRNYHIEMPWRREVQCKGWWKCCGIKRCIGRVSASAVAEESLSKGLVEMLWHENVDWRGWLRFCGIGRCMEGWWMFCGIERCIEGVGGGAAA